MAAERRAGTRNALSSRFREIRRFANPQGTLTMRRLHQPSYRLKQRTRLTLLCHKYRRYGIVYSVVSEKLQGLFKDALLSLNIRRLEKPELTWLWDEAEVTGSPNRWCFYAAYSPRSIISDMVLEQLKAYRDAGFRIAFITMSNRITDRDMAKLKPFCPLVIRRQSHGRDFGAWVHAAALLCRQMETATALLLTNDSILGPISPMDRWIEPCLTREGVFGLTESYGNGSHLQSYFLLGNGVSEVSSMLAFLRSMRLSFSKWIMIQRGEIKFTRAMQRRGHFTAALIGYEALEGVLLENREYQAELETIAPHLFHGFKSPNNTIFYSSVHEDEKKNMLAFNKYLLRSRLYLHPFNPSHHFNQVLLKHFKFPFIKAELIMRNPGMLPSVPDWPEFVTDESPVSVQTIEEHLATLE
jgi:hypothetical protein